MIAACALRFMYTFMVNPFPLYTVTCLFVQFGQVWKMQRKLFMIQIAEAVPSRSMTVVYIYILKAFVSSSVMHLGQGLQKHTVSLKCNWHLYLISGTLADISQEAVGRLLRRANNRNSYGKKKRDNNPRQHDSIGTVGPVNFFCFLDIVTI